MGNDANNLVPRVFFLPGARVKVCKGGTYVGLRPKMGRKVCLNTVKKDRLRAIALMKRKQILKALLEMVALTEVNPAKLFQNVFKVIQMELKSVQ